MKKLVLVMIGLIVILTVSGCSKYINDTDNEIYDKMAAENEVMPGLNEIGSYLELYTNKNTYNYLAPIFKSETYTLIAKYDADEYEKQKSSIDKNYSFDTSLLNPEPEFDLDGFRFGLLCDKYIDYPHTLYFIGFNDNDKAISYIYFYDQDLDVIDQPYDQFLREYSDWKYGAGYENK